MYGTQSGKRIEKPIPGCLGRMVNFFDLSAGIPGNKLLTDGPPREGNKLDAAKMSSPTFGDQIEDKKIVSEVRRASSKKKADGMPMKMLIAQEMTRDVDVKREPPSVVAKLMGLEALPQRQLDSAAALGRHSNSCSRSAYEVQKESWQQGDHCLQKEMRGNIHSYREQSFRDIYEIWQQPEKPGYVRNISSKEGRHDEGNMERNKALIRQKFMEAKHMSVDEKLRKSKEYQDALEVLSSNRDLFLEFLQEPNSMSSKSLAELNSISSTPETKRITILRPFKQVDNQSFTTPGKNNINPANRSIQVVSKPVRERYKSSHSPTFINNNFSEHPAQPTRIVVLKPTILKDKDIIGPVSSPYMSPGMEDQQCEGPENVGTRYPSEIPKKITQHICEDFMGHRRDETQLSFISDGSIGSESSSFNKIDKEYVAGSLSKTEDMSPTSRHSWDCVDKFGSPYSCSSFSRASCSPESSVCKEAKKRLSERWAMMASNDDSHEKHAWKSSSTLGEMLALFDTKKSHGYEDDSGDEEAAAQGSASMLTSVHHEDNSGDPPKNLSRSKTLPIASVRFKDESKDPETEKTHNSKELFRSKSTRSSLKGKVAGLFLSRIKKTANEKYAVASKADAPCGTVEAARSPVHSSDDVSTESVDNSVLEDSKSSYIFQSSGITSPDLSVARQSTRIISQESPLSVTKVTSSNTGEKSDQPSPISVLEPPFQDGDNANLDSSDKMKAQYLGTHCRTEPLRSNLIDKSPPVGTIARTLSWGDSCPGTAATSSLKPSLSIKGLLNKEDLFSLVQGLLALAGLDGEMPRDSFYVQWHSHESPLDLSLRDKDVNLCTKETLDEGNQSQARSNWKLVFDCVNSALVEISENELDRSIKGRPCGGAYSSFMDGGPLKLVNCIWAQLKEWLFSDGAGSSLVVERAVNNEVVKGGWVVQMRVEQDIIGNDIMGKLMEELVEETVIELTSWSR